MPMIPVFKGELPYLSTAQMIEVDRAMMHDYGISLTQMMENAGRNLASLARDRFLKQHPQGARVLVLAGSGGNGGGALVAARRLHNWGANVSVILSKDPASYKGVPATQLNILQHMNLPITHSSSVLPADVDVILDGLIGYSLKGAPQGVTAALIQQANAHAAPVLSLDIPSGIDSNSGQVFEPAIKAAGTMTLALPKEALRAKQALAHVGALYLADISVPPGLYAKAPLNLQVPPIFVRNDIVQLLTTGT